MKLKQSSRMDKPNALALPKSLQVSVQVCRFVVVLGLGYILDAASLFVGQHSLQPLRIVWSALYAVKAGTHTWLISAIVSFSIPVPVTRL